MKDIKRLQAAAQLGNNMENGIVRLTLTDHDGGQFGLIPKIDSNSLVLADPIAPRYALEITATDADTMDRFAKACATLARNMRGDDGGEQD